MTADSTKYWRDVLKSPKYVVAPMVDQSELAWRLLCRRHGAQLCYTPMFHAQNFVKDSIYRRDNMQTCPEDRPLIVQFCANDPEILVQACKLVADLCDGVDLNLGCPQSIAKRGHYGAFLQDEWPLIAELVRSVHECVKIPISCKIRVFEEIEKTVEYARMLEAAGCKLLTVHGRTREQKGRNTGVASWNHVKAVKNAVKIPVISNGNIQFFGDVQRCIDETGADGVMSAEGNLHNPFIFENYLPPPCWEPTLEYLNLVDEYPCSMSFIRGHLFKMLHYSLLQFPDIREKLACASTVEDCRSLTIELKQRCQDLHEKYRSSEMPENSDLKDFYWLCQPYVRPSTSNDELVDAQISNVENNPSSNSLTIDERVKSIKRQHQEEIEKLSEKFGLSRKKAKRLIKHPEKSANSVEKTKQPYNKCTCGNPLSPKCSFKMCKTCCRIKLNEENVFCEVHRFHKFCSREVVTR